MHGGWRGAGSPSFLPLAGGTDGGSWPDTVIGWFKDPTSLLLAMGPWVLVGVAIIVFVESGVLFPLLPGDSLIFAAGLLHTQLGIRMWVLIGVILVTAFLGAQVGYWIGWKWGRGLFKDDARFLKAEYLVQAENFFDRYGGRALVIGRFVPFVRTFVPLAAGIARFPYGRFLVFNTLGALIWGGGVTWAGTALGGVQFVHDHLEVIIVLIVFVSVIPMVVEIGLSKRRAKAEGSADEESDSESDAEGTWGEDAEVTATTSTEIGAAPEPDNESDIAPDTEAEVSDA